MRSVRQQSTAPELVVRKALHRLGLRFVLHPAALPGRPDIALPRRRTVIFVHGCFWHGHNCRHGASRAKSNTDYWRDKIATNRRRDRRKEKELRALGWIVETVWECEAEVPKHLERLARHLLNR